MCDKTENNLISHWQRTKNEEEEEEKNQNCDWAQSHFNLISLEIKP